MVVVHQVAVFLGGFDKVGKVVVLGDEDFSHAAAAQSHVCEDVVGKTFELTPAFVAVEHCHAVARISDDMREFGEIAFVIAVGAAFRRGYYGVEVVHAVFGESHVVLEFGGYAHQHLGKVWDKHVVAVGELDKYAVARGQHREEIAPARHRHVAVHNHGNGLWFAKAVEGGVGGKPLLEMWLLQMVHCT